ncbi:MAG: CRP-like cAMP-binding protein [Candidatus Latescibacterota bacterium]|jgi:CRP-like cAMP-binding protein
MLTVVEKVILLQEVDIFSEVPTQQLAYLAAILVEVSHADSEQIYQARDYADSMYIVLEGRVRLHREELEITIVGPGDPFGTWALFDDEPRVSAATVLESVRLLRLNKEDFIDLLADNVGITQGVLKALVSRVRGLIGRVGGSH